MENATLDSPLRGPCPAPFFDQSKFGSGGSVHGRVCAPIARKDNSSCCLPCPTTDYLFPRDFKAWSRAAEALNLVGLLCMVFLLVSFIVLPAEKTRRHYLSYCLVIAATLLALGFAVPFVANPEQCFDEVTPNDIHTDLTCAFSGAFIITGGISIAVWVFLHALCMHVRICWDVELGSRFDFWAQGLGWTVAVGLSAITMAATGASFRFGNVCHVNATHSLADFWGPLLAVAGVATILQLGTLAYCIRVYLRTKTQSSMGLPLHSNSVETRSPHDIYRRMCKVVRLQWRGIVIVGFMLVDVLFFSVVFARLDSARATNDLELAMPFLVCLAGNPVSHERCTELSEKLFVNPSTVIAVLLMRSLAGIQVFILLVRTSMFTAWVNLVKQSGHEGEYVSRDARETDQSTAREP